MFDQIKATMFTIPGVIVTLIHVFVVVGGITCFIAFETQVLGNDPLAQMQQSSAVKRK